MASSTQAIAPWILSMLCALGEAKRPRLITRQPVQSANSQGAKG
jgi:hypothetical protein